MSKGERKRDLSRSLDSHIRSIEETFQILDAAAPPTLEKVDWSQVAKLGDEVSKQATIAGMLWGGEAPDAKALTENMSVYFNVLQGFLLICHGSTVGAGPTLHKCINTSARRVVDCSLSFFREAVSSYESQNSGKRLSVPQLTGAVWEACGALKKVPTTNCTAIGRAMTQVAVCLKDIQREMQELASVDSSADSADGSSNEAVETASGSDQELGDELSSEEITIVRLVVCAVSDVLTVVKEVIRFVTGLLKCSSQNGSKTEDGVDSLERLLINCQKMADEVNDLGCCVYSPQDISQMKSIIKNMYGRVQEMRGEVGMLGGSPDGLFSAVVGFENSLKELESRLCGDQLVNEMALLSV
ncbi:hypothetical protein ACMD2_22066 [Ananas comosus]|uniref:Cyclin-D1-binding protein n=2 Tax=Ananas comosus TaxID=4615 RepID=A0A199UZ46_ANACO|nr:hypothetical protein ACMD2_22066 [Ananas comosus]CAD1823572.1 unnamed protein product [Ananas comosus var. bracteatus]